MHYFAPLVQSQQLKLPDTKANVEDEILAVSDLQKREPHPSPVELGVPRVARYEVNTHVFRIA